MRQIVLEEDVDDLDDDDAVVTDDENEDEELFDDDDEGQEFGVGNEAPIGRIRSGSARSQALTDEDEDVALFGEMRNGDDLERRESGVNLGRGTDLSATTILRGNG